MNGSIRNCSVAVIGGAGFLGSHLVEHLAKDRGCKVLAVDNLCTGQRSWVHQDAAFLHHDITDSESRLHWAFREHDVKWVFNYAAEPYVPFSYVRPVHVTMANAIGAMKVINAAHEAGCIGILQVSSAELYGSGSFDVATNRESPMGWDQETRIAEDAPVDPRSSYGVSKAMIDQWIQVRWKEARSPCIALRQFNCLGERETHPYVIPEIISQLAEQQRKCDNCDGAGWCDGSSGGTWQCPACVGWGWAAKNGIVRLGNDSTRDFMYAGDAVRAAVELLERGRFGEVYNLGSESFVRIYDLARMIGSAMGFQEVLVEVDEARKRRWELWHLCSDNSKIHGVISRRSTVPFEEALKRTIRWFMNNGRNWPWPK